MGMQATTEMPALRKATADDVMWPLAVSQGFTRYWAKVPYEGKESVTESKARPNRRSPLYVIAMEFPATLETGMSMNGDLVLFWLLFHPGAITIHSRQLQAEDDATF